MAALRGHHLICLHFYHGEGYDEAFIRNLERVMENAGTEGVLVASGPDDICLSCLHLREGLCMATPGAEQEIREMDRKALELLDLTPGMRAGWAAIEDRIPALFRLWYDCFCRDCGWRGSCEKDRGFLLLKAANP
ncbi:MAG: DUF1284 domain-containing protein [Thermodesulfovibrionales bacterium]